MVQGDLELMWWSLVISFEFRQVFSYIWCQTLNACFRQNFNICSQDKIPRNKIKNTCVVLTGVEPLPNYLEILDVQHMTVDWVQLIFLDGGNLNRDERGVACFCECNTIIETNIYAADWVFDEYLISEVAIKFCVTEPCCICYSPLKYSLHWV